MALVTPARCFSLFLLLATSAAAPYLKTGSSQGHAQLPLDHLFRPSQGLIGPLFRQNDHSIDPPTHGGCYYQFRHYDEGDRIITNEPCLNCTCHNSMLMCYLKVCPFSKPIGQECTVEKDSNQCCPIITCPQVPVNLQVMQMSTTTQSSASTEIVPYSKHGCTIQGDFYPDGAQVPGDPRNPCELCYCIRNHTACLMQECILKVDGCNPVFESGICCPIRYKCTYDDEPLAELTTTMSPANDTVITTTLIPQIGGCSHNLEFYADGAFIRSEDPCEHCYCMKNDIVCAIQECRSPLDEDDEKCVPRMALPGKCCPEAYDCPETPEFTTVIPFGIVPETTSKPEVDVPEMKTESATTEKTTAEPDVDIEIISMMKPEITTLHEDLEMKVVTTISPIGELDPKIKNDTEDTKSTDSDVVAFETRTTGPDDEMFLTTTPIADETTFKAEPEIATTEKSKPETEQPDVIAVDTTEGTSIDTEPITEKIADPEIILEIVDLDITPDSETTTEETVQPDVTTVMVTDKVVEPEIDPALETTEPDVTTEKDIVTDIVTKPEITPIPEKIVTTEVPADIETTTEKAVVSEVIDDFETVTVKTSKPDIETTTELDVEPEIKVTSESETVTDIPIDKTTTLILSESTEGVVGEGNCLVNNITYRHKNPVPTTSACQQTCECKNSIVTCELAACKSAPPAFLLCNTRTSPEECCPIYECPPIDTDSVPSEECIRDGKQYLEGEFVPSPDLCSDCYCMHGEILCAIQDCPKVNSTCKAIETPKGSCCPTKYECFEMESVDVVDPVTTTESISKDEVGTTMQPTKSVSVPESTDPTVPTDHEIQEDEDIVQDKMPVPFNEGCGWFNNKEYNHGDMIPSNKTCQRNCICSNGVVKCDERRCITNGDGCGTLDNKEYLHGDMVPSFEDCQNDCICSNGVVKCDESLCITTEASIEKVVAEIISTQTPTIPEVTEPAFITKVSTESEVLETTKAPTEPELPVTTETPSDPEIIDSTETPSDPEIIDTTETPSDPELIVTTEIPSDLEIIVTAEPPRHPEIIFTTKASIESEVLETTKALTEPELPVITETPSDPEITATTETPSDPEITVTTETPSDPKIIITTEVLETTKAPTEPAITVTETHVEPEEVATTEDPIESKTIITTETPTEPEIPVTSQATTESKILVTTEAPTEPEIFITTEDLMEPEILVTTTASTKPEEIITTTASTDPKIFVTTEVLETTKAPIEPEITVTETHVEPETVVTIEDSIEPETIVTTETPTVPELLVTSEPITESKILETTQASTEPEAFVTTEDFTEIEILVTSTVSTEPEVLITTEAPTDPIILVTTVASTEPEKLVTTVAPTEPEIFVTTEDLTEPEIFVTTAVSTESEKLITTEAPIDPAILVTAEAPIEPEVLVTTEAPTEPEILVTTKSPTEPQILVITEVPTVPELPDIAEITTEIPTKPEIPETTTATLPEIDEITTEPKMPITTEILPDTFEATTEIDRPEKTEIPPIDEVSTMSAIEEKITTTEAVEKPAPEDKIEPSVEVTTGTVPAFKDGCALFNNKEYNHGDTVPSNKTCQRNCICSNGVVKCDERRCITTGDGCGWFDNKEYMHGKMVPSFEDCQKDCICSNGIVMCDESLCVTEKPIQNITIGDLVIEADPTDEDIGAVPESVSEKTTTSETDKIDTVTEVPEHTPEVATTKPVITDVTEISMSTEVSTDPAEIEIISISKAPESEVLTTTEAPSDPELSTATHIKPEVLIITEVPIEPEIIITTKAPTEPEILLTTEITTQPESTVTTLPDTDKFTTEPKMPITTEFLPDTFEATTEIDMPEKTELPLTDKVSTTAVIEPSVEVTTDTVSEKTTTPKTEKIDIVTEVPEITSEVDTTEPVISDVTETSISTEVPTESLEIEAIAISKTPEPSITEVTTESVIQDVTIVSTESEMPAVIEVSTEPETIAEVVLPDAVEISTEASKETITEIPVATVAVGESDSDIMTTETSISDIENATDIAETPTTKTVTLGPVEPKIPAETSPETEFPISTTIAADKIIAEDYCSWFDNVYEHEEIVPPHNTCQETCVCTNGEVNCEHKACEPLPPAFLKCETVHHLDICCPIYQCPPPTSEGRCMYEGRTYFHGEYVPSNTDCLDCFCIEGAVSCATLLCGIPQNNCEAIRQGTDDCCPTAYNCTESITTAIIPTTVAATVDEETTTDGIFTSSTMPEKLDITTKASVQPVPENITHPDIPEFDGEQIVETTTEIILPKTTMSSSTMISTELIDIIESTYLPPTTNVTETTTWTPTTTTEFVLGPGSCLFDGKVYVSAQQIPRDDPCDFCFCFRGDIICLQQTCPPPIPGCYEEAIPGFCCPRYECPVQQAIINITTTTKPFPSFPAQIKTSRESVCEIEGEYYAVGQVVTAASSPCHECKCGRDGFMKCLPIECDTPRKVVKHPGR